MVKEEVSKTHNSKSGQIKPNPSQLAGYNQGQVTKYVLIQIWMTKFLKLIQCAT